MLALVTWTAWSLVLLLSRTAPAAATLPAVSITIGQTDGSIRPLLGVNAGPIALDKEGKALDFSEAYRRVGVASVRTHDFYGPLDMATLYPDQGADPSQRSSYRFEESDRAFRAIVDGGFTPYLRLGDSWNAGPQFPKPTRRAPINRRNWTRAAVEVVRHYRDLAGGRLRYVEIWNEPDIPRFWDASRLEFFDLFDETARAVKSAFPDLRVGGPGFAYAAWALPKGRTVITSFLDYLRTRQTPLDFLSWHVYANDPAQFVDIARFYRDELDRHGFTSAESHVTEYSTDERQVPAGLNAAALRVGSPGAAIMTASWIALQREGIAQAFYYRGADMSMDQPTFYGLLRADGTPKKVALAFSLWSRLAGCRDQLAVATSGIDRAPLWVIAARGSTGEVVLLLANPSRERLAWRIVSALGRTVTGLTLEEVSDSSDTVVVHKAADNAGFIPAYAVQLVTVRTQSERYK